MVKLLEWLHLPWDEVIIIIVAIMKIIIVIIFTINVVITIIIVIVVLHIAVVIVLCLFHLFVRQAVLYHDCHQLNHYHHCNNHHHCNHHHHSTNYHHQSDLLVRQFCPTTSRSTSQGVSGGSPFKIIGRQIHSKLLVGKCNPFKILATRFPLFCYGLTTLNLSNSNIYNQVQND